MKTLKIVLIIVAVILVLTIAVLSILAGLGVFGTKEQRLVESKVSEKVSNSGNTVHKTSAKLVTTTTSSAIKYYIVTVEYTDPDGHETTACYSVRAENTDYNIEYQFSIVQY